MTCYTDERQNLSFNDRSEIDSIIQFHWKYFVCTGDLWLKSWVNLNTKWLGGQIGPSFLSLSYQKGSSWIFYALWIRKMFRTQFLRRLGLRKVFLKISI